MAQYPSTTVNSKLAVTKSNTAGASQVGTVTLTGNAATSSWGQVTASLTAETVFTSISLQSSAAPGLASYNYVEVGIGGAGSEVAIAAEPIVPNPGATAFATVVRLSVPLRVAAGQRVAARVTIPGSMNGSSVLVAVHGAPYANLEGN